MRIYIANGIYYATQAEAKKGGKDWSPVDFPSKQADIIAFLNRRGRRGAPLVDAPVETAKGVSPDAMSLL